MKQFRSDTLAHFKASPMFKPWNQSNVSVVQAVAELNAYFAAQPGSASVEDSAIKFYLMNHAFSEMQHRFDVHEPLPAEWLSIPKSYMALLSPAVIRLVYYMMLIVTRESRHVKKSATFLNGIKKKHGEVYGAYLSSIPSGSNEAAIYFRQNPPQGITLVEYLSGVTTVFNTGSFSTGYGGKPWGGISQCLLDFVAGTTSAETMVDTAWTLAHNNGPMFNKGMLFNGFDQNTTLKILDVQRAGMIPQLIAQFSRGEVSLHSVSTDTKKMWKSCRDLLGETFDGYVDWYAVEAAGCMKKGGYPQEKAKQDVMFGKVPQQQQQKAEDGKRFYVNEHEWVLIKERKAA